MLKMDAAALQGFLDTDFTEVSNDFRIDRVDEGSISVRLHVSDKHLRPGGTISGPSMFGLADVSVYLAILSKIGLVPLAVTTNCSMDFMRKPQARTDLICDTRLLKLGRVLAVGDCLIRSDGSEAPVARATMTYSIPPA
ncbi:MAG: PaaI family thioesterase [Pseudomonadota bacterium]